MSYAVTRYELATYRIAGGTSCLPLRASFSPIHASKVDGNKKQELVPTELHEWHVFTRRPETKLQTLSCKRSSLCLGSDFGNPCFLTVLTSGWMDKITNFFSCAVGHRTTIPPKPFRMSSLARAAVTSLLARSLGNMHLNSS